MQRSNPEAATVGQRVARALSAALLLACQPSPALPGEEESSHHVNSVGMKMVLIPKGSFTMGTRRPRVDGWNEQRAVCTQKLIIFAEENSTEPGCEKTAENEFAFYSCELNPASFRKFSPADFNGPGSTFLNGRQT